MISDNDNSASQNPADEEFSRALQLEQLHEAVKCGGLVKLDLPSEAKRRKETDLSAELRLLCLIEGIRRKNSEQLSADTGRSADSAQVISSAAGPGSAETLPSSDGTDPLRRIGRFEILHELGKGGCGIVFLAHDPRLDRHVAVKVPRAELMVSDDGPRRFLREVKAAALLAHPGIVTVYEAGQSDQILYMASEWINGPTLSAWIREHTGQCDCRGAARMVAWLADAIAHAHARGVLHRDLKPSNILLDVARAGLPDFCTLDQLAPHARISDFGMARVLSDDARITGSRELVGTPAYLAPEQIQGGSEQNGMATDIYGLGAIFYELLTGQPPFSGPSVAATIRRVETEDPVPPRKHYRQIPRDLEAICLKCLRKLPEERYGSAYELRDDLERWLTGRPIRARRESVIERTKKWICRNLAVSLTACIAFVGISIGLLTSVLQWSRAESARLRAEALLVDTEETVTSLMDAAASTFEPMEPGATGQDPIVYVAVAAQRKMFEEQFEKDPGVIFSTAQVVFNAGEFHALAGRFKDAETEFREVLRLVALPKIPQEQRQNALELDFRARLRLAEVLRANGRFYDMLTLVQPALDRLGPAGADEPYQTVLFRADLMRAAADAQLNFQRVKQVRFPDIQGPPRSIPETQTAKAEPDAERLLKQAENMLLRFPADREHLEAIILRAKILLIRSGQYRLIGVPSARSQLEKTLEITAAAQSLDPGNPNVRELMVNAQLALFDRDLDDQWFDSAERTFPHILREARLLTETVPKMRKFRQLYFGTLCTGVRLNRKLNRPEQVRELMESVLEASRNFERDFGVCQYSINMRLSAWTELARFWENDGKDLMRAADAHRAIVEICEERVDLTPDHVGNKFVLSLRCNDAARFHTRHGAVLEAADVMMKSRNSINQVGNVQKKHLMETYDILGKYLIRAARFDEAFASAKLLADLYPEKPEYTLSAAAMMSTCAAEATNVARDGFKVPELDTPVQQEAAQIAAGQFTAESLMYLQQAVRSGLTDRKNIAGDPRFEAVRGHPDFQVIINSQ